MKNKSYDFKTSYIDLLLNCLFLFLFLFMLEAILIQSSKPIVHEGIKKDAAYMIQMDWDPKLDCDLDLWVQGPTGEIVYYGEKSAGLMNLERDDLGIYGDTVNVNGKVIQNPLNEEVWILRGLVPGNYVVNSHLYGCRSVANDLATKMEVGTPVNIVVSFKLIRLNPSYSEIDIRNITLHKIWEEKTVYTFNIAEDGSSSIIDDSKQVGLLTQKEQK